MDCVARRASLSCAAVKASPRASTTNGRRSFSRLASVGVPVIARGGRVIFLSDAEGAEKLGGMAATTIALPAVDPFVAPILHAIPVQLLAYHTAVLKGTDVDQPRNLAKLVTVE